MTSTDSPAAEILIVEDSRTQVELLRYLLENEGYTVRAALSGGEALKAARERRPDLVISDIVMPGMSGYELCAAIKGDPALRAVPVILRTGLADVEDIVRGLQAQADYYVTKSDDESYLLSRVRALLSQPPSRENGNEIEVELNGHRHVITSGRRQMLNLLISTYESAIQQNRKLAETQVELKQQQEQLAKYAEELGQKNAQLEDDLNMARELQQALLPEASFGLPKSAPPAAQTLRFCHHYQPATIIGGDFFDVLPLSENETGVLVGDVMGHGVRPALVTSLVRGLAQEMRPVARDPGEFMTKLNRGLTGILRQTRLPIFASAFYLVADTATGELRFSCAGHPAPFHVRAASGAVELLKAPPGTRRGAALGVLEESAYVTSRVPVEVLDRVILFTDGLFEIESADGDLYDEKRLLDAVRRRARLPLETMFSELLAELRRFSGSGEFDDDVCLVGVEVEKVGKWDDGCGSGDVR